MLGRMAALLMVLLLQLQVGHLAGQELTRFLQVKPVLVLPQKIQLGKMPGYCVAKSSGPSLSIWQGRHGPGESL